MSKSNREAETFLAVVAQYARDALSQGADDLSPLDMAIRYARALDNIVTIANGGTDLWVLDPSVKYQVKS